MKKERIKEKWRKKERRNGVNKGKNIRKERKTSKHKKKT